MKIIQGNCGGIVFRKNIISGENYSFIVCQDDVYHLYKYTDNNNSSELPLSADNNATISTGLNRTNLIAVVALTGTIMLFINNQQVDTVQDNTYTTGYIGLVADDAGNPTEVSYSNAKVWKL